MVNSGLNGCGRDDDFGMVGCVSGDDDDARNAAGDSDTGRGNLRSCPHRRNYGADGLPCHAACENWDNCESHD